MVDIPIVLDHTSKVPMYVQLYEALRNAISKGELKTGETLPSTRDLARKLGIARHTIAKATELLIGHGYLESSNQVLRVIRSSDHQADDADDSDNGARAIPLPSHAISQFARKVCAEENVLMAAALNQGGVPFEELPVDQWKKILLQHMRQGFNADELYSDPLGYMPLREAIAAYLNRFRSLRCRSTNVVIFAGPTSALDFTARLMLDPGDPIALENPGFRTARRVLTANGGEAIPIPVDNDGVVVERLRNTAKQAKLIYVTPAHQDPTGAVMSLERRKQLLDWAAQTHSFILEDGFDSEYWYKMRPLPAIQGLDERECVIYFSSFWRALFPVSRVSFAVFPDRFMPAVSFVKGMLEREVPVLEQKVITDFLSEGFLERHLRRTHKLFTDRRMQLIMALTKQFGNKVWIAKESGGMNLLIQLNIEPSEEKILEAARNVKLPLISTREYYIINPVPRQFLVPFANMDENEIVDRTRDFALQVL